MVSNVTAKKPLFPVSFEIFRANVNHTNQEIICKIETSRKIILNFAVSSRSSKLVIWQTHIFLKYYRQMRENKIVANNGSSIVLYTTEDGNTQLEVKQSRIRFGSLKAKWQSYVVVNLINKDNQ